MSYLFESLHLLSERLPLSSHLEKLLNSLSIPTVECSSLDSLGELASESQDTFWLLIENDESSLISAARKLVRGNQPHLSVLRTEAGAYVGPTYMERGTACVHCASLRLLSNNAEPRLIDPLRSRDIEEILWETVVYRELLALRTGQLPVLTVNHLLDCDAFNAKIERRRVLRVPRCPICRASDLPLFSAWQVDRA